MFDSWRPGYFAPTELKELLKRGAINISSLRDEQNCPKAQQARTMTDDQPNPEGNQPALNQAELAHSIIESLLEHTRVVSDLIAVMAQALDSDTTKALTQTAQWQAYLESRRRMERTRTDVEKFVETVKKLEGNG